MALDLFLVPHQPKSRSRSALLQARQALLDALQAAHPQATLVGDASQGHVANFPLGELHISPGELHWALHGVDDAAPVDALADWFFAHGFEVKDPQDAGFARPRPKPASLRGSLDDLVGGQWLGLRFDRDYATALDLEFALADGRRALLRMLHLGRCQIPELSPLVNAVVTAATLGPRDIAQYESLVLQFDGAHALVFTDAVFGGVSITA